MLRQEISLPRGAVPSGWVGRQSLISILSGSEWNMDTSTEKHPIESFRTAPILLHQFNESERSSAGAGSHR